MNDSQDRLREILRYKGDRVHSSLTISDIRDAGGRSQRRPGRVLGPVLVAVSVVIVVVVVALTGRQHAPTVRPADTRPSSSVPTPTHPTSADRPQMTTTDPATVSPDPATVSPVTSPANPSP